MSYYDSAEGVEISWERATHELAKHGLTEQSDRDEFERECWIYWSDVKTETIPARQVLDYLGY